MTTRQSRSTMLDIMEGFCLSQPSFEDVLVEEPGDLLDAT